MRLLNLEKKLKVFEVICGDWNYRNIDMTEPHLQKIDIVQNNLLISCELFSPDLDEYLSCDGGIIKDKKLVKKFKRLNLEKKDEVLNFISDINSLINWDKVDNDLYDQVELEKMQRENEGNIELNDCYEDDIVVIPAEKLGEGWNWHKYNDGSGYLESPDGKQYMSYDLDTNEYKVTRDLNYDFFPLSYYYVDGVDPSEFNPFEYMENEMLNFVLPKERKSKEISL